MFFLIDSILECGSFFFFLNDPAPPEISPLPLPAAFPFLVGDGPKRTRLEQLARSLEIEKAVSFCGWISHEEVLSRMRSADVLVFPSIRDNGAGVVFEALEIGRAHV